MQAYAQQQTIVMQGGKIISGGGAASAQAGEEQQLMNDAPNYVLRRDYQGAEGLYTHVIGINKNNIGAYIQRGLVRRELGNQQGAMADGQIAVTLTNELMNTLPNNANLYYQRAMGFRLMRQFPQAREDMQKAINLAAARHGIMI